MKTASTLHPRGILHAFCLIGSLLLLSGCVGTHDASMRLFSSAVSAQAVLGDVVLNGQVQLYTDRSGTLELVANDTALRCMGELRHTATRSGVISLHCSDGTQAQLIFAELTPTSGHGSSAADHVTLAYGLGPELAMSYLRAPAGKRLVIQAGRLTLE